MDFDVEEVGLEDWNMRTIDIPDVCDPAIVRQGISLWLVFLSVAECRQAE